MTIRLILRNSKNWLSILLTHISRDRMTMIAGSLTYTTLLALVPLIAVVFYLMSAFPMFSDISTHFKTFIFENLVPTAGDVVQNYIEQFIKNLNKMTAIGVCGLLVTTLLLINSVDSAFNYIWHSKYKRPLLHKLVIYWTILTLGPILIGISIAVSSYIFSLHVFGDSGSKAGFIISLLPFILSCVGFWLLYSVIPTESVPLLDAAIGAIVAATLFELGKKAFAFYITSFPTYQLIYGVLATIPILFFWIYCSWCIVLLGAEITVSFRSYRHIYTNKKPPSVTVGHKQPSLNDPTKEDASQHNKTIKVSDNKEPS